MTQTCTKANCFNACLSITDEYSFFLFFWVKSIEMKRKERKRFSSENCSVVLFSFVRSFTFSLSVVRFNSVFGLSFSCAGTNGGYEIPFKMESGRGNG